MRIIAGTAKGRTIAAPKGMDTRPTLDRVRESLFSILMPWLPDARVLDLFAGSGALGLEAISRGAQEAVFADIARAAQEAVQGNIETLRMQGSATLLRMDWRMALRKLASEGKPFDLVFLDPPYQLAQAGEMLETLRESGLLTEESLVVYEHGADTPPDTTGWHVHDERTYRDTIITFLQLPEGGNGDA